MDDKAISSLFRVKIDFSQSHTLFPTIVIYFLLLLLALIFLIYGIPKIKKIMRGELKFQLDPKKIDKLRFFGTIVLTILYFMMMNYVGQFFPNTGLGFLFVSIPFIFLLSLLYSHGMEKSKLLVIVINAVLAPSIAWYVLAQLFNISLP